MADPGVRLTSLPPLGTVVDDARVAGAKGSGIGTFTLPAIKAYALQGVPNAADLLTLQTQVNGLANTAGLQLITNADLAQATLAVASRATDLENTASLQLTTNSTTASALLAVQTTTAGLTSAASSQLTTNATTATAITNLAVTNTSQGLSIATLNTTTSALATADTAQAASITTLNATTAGHTATLTTLASVNATMGATYDIKTNVSGQVVGFGLTNTGTTTGTGITFTTPTFKIFDGTTGQTPFEVAGGIVSIKNAAIQTAAIDQFKLSDGSVITAKMALNAASEAFSFYTAASPQHGDLFEHSYVAGTIVVPAGGSAYLFARAQGFTYEGTAFRFRLYVNAALVAQLTNPASNFLTPYGTQDLQTTNPQIIVLGSGSHAMEMFFQQVAITADPTQNPKPLIGHLVGFVQKR